jgi:hypothetical protein
MSDLNIQVLEYTHMDKSNADLPAWDSTTEEDILSMWLGGSVEVRDKMASAN